MVPLSFAHVLQPTTLFLLLLAASVGATLPQGGPDVDPRKAKDTVLGTYSGPYADGRGLWTEAFDKASDLVSQMTLLEKISLTTGEPGPCEGNVPAIPRLGLPGFCLQDGPSGLRFESFVSQFSAAVTVAGSWDRELIEARGVALGKEFRGRGIHTQLGPTTGGPLGRSPLGGRNWEGFSPDPYLSSQGSYLTVRAIQSQGVIACLKHYIGYEQETFRTARWRINGTVQTFRQISSEIDDKTLHETYLPSFAESLRAGAGSVMCSYNSVNGTHLCEHSTLLNDILKTELNFQGFVVSDWDATWSNDSSALAGLDQTMPGQGMTKGGDFGLSLEDLVKAGDVPESRIDDMARRILTPYFQLGQDKGFPKSPTNKPRTFTDDSAQVVFGASDAPSGFEEDDDVPDVQSDHYKLIRKIGAESTILLKNVADSLPIRKRTRRLAIFGSDAGPSSLGLQSCGDNDFCSDEDRPYFWPGTITTGAGSGSAFAPYVITPLEAIAARGREQRKQVDFVLQDDAYLHINRTATVAEQCFVFVSAFAFEGYDRDDLHLWNEGDRLIETVASHCSNTVVVIHSPGPVLMESWLHHPNVTAVLLALLPGQESGNSIADVLFGDANPSGKLPFTLGKDLSDWPPRGIISDLVDEPNAHFTEGNLIDYRWFDAHQIEPSFPFGFGLSYTNFKYGSPMVKLDRRKDDSALQQTNEIFSGQGGLYDYVYTITVDVTNVGQVTGSEVVQLYLSFPDTEEGQPPSLLRGFDKVKHLLPSQTATAEFKLRNKDVALWNVVEQRWTVPEGLRVRVASHSRDFDSCSTLLDLPPLRS